MKVKNIAFSGFMAAILMGATGAHAAINVASQAYVDGKLSKKADVTAVSTLEGTVSTLTQTVADNKSAAETAVSTLTQTVADNKSAAEAAIQANAEAIALKADQSALDTLAGDVYRKAQTYTQDEVKAYVSKTLTDIGEGNISLEGYAKTQDVNNALNLKADKTQVATDIASAITSANGYTDAEIAKLSAEGGAVANAAAAAAAAQAKANDNAGAITLLQGKDTAIDNEIAGLKSADTAINDKIGDVTEGKTVVEMIAEAKSEATYDDTALAGRVTTAEGKISANETAIATNAENIAKKQDALSEAQLLAANSGISAEKVAEYNAAVSELSNKISMPEACTQPNGNCVLGIMNQKVQWINLTEPVDDEQPEA